MLPNKIAAGKFKAECLHLLNEVHEKNVSFIVTKHGKPYAKLSPIDEQPIDYFGCMKDSVVIVDPSIEPIDEVWNANQ